jgi:hypothetical protein
MGEPVPIIVQAEPVALDRAEALTFTRLAPKMFDQLEAAGRIKGKRMGRNGAMIYRTAELRQVVDQLFGIGAANDIDDEFAALGAS